MKSSMEACSWLERSAQTSFAAALASLLSISSILPFPGFFLPHSYALQSPHFCEMAFCVGLFFPFSPFSVSLVKWNLTFREGGSLFLCLFITQNWRQTAGLRQGAVCLTLSLWQAWCLAVVRAQFHVPSFSPATFALHSYYQAVKPRWVSSDRFLAQAGDLPLVWWVGVVTLSWQQGVWTEVTTWGPACACLLMQRQAAHPPKRGALVPSRHVLFASGGLLPGQRITDHGEHIFNGFQFLLKDCDAGKGLCQVLA